MTWNFAYERSLPGRWVLDVAYVGNGTVHASILYNLNAATVYGAGAAGQPEFAPFGRTASTIEYFGQFRDAYDSLQINMDHHFSHNFAFTNSYTWGKALGPAGEDSDYITGMNDYVTLHRDWASTDFNIASILSQSLIWQLPFGKGMAFLHSGVGNAVSGGWELSGSWVAHTGFPLNFSCTCSGLTERFKLMLRTEWLNATNTPQFNAPNTTLGSGSFGLVTSANGQRSIDVAAKLTF